LLLDVIAGGQTLFIRANQEEAAWSVLIPILLRAAGTWGPEAVALLIPRGRRSALLPTTVLEERKAA
jgi:glucose-6-phosphate 1-dehydrogenase